MKDLYKDIWPQERDIIWRPDRLKYLRRVVKNDACVFCEAVKSGVSKESLLLHKNDHAMVIVNKYPYNAGHVLVLPIAHKAEFDELDEDEFEALHKLLRQSVSILKSTYKSSGMNIGMNLGRAAGAGIPGHLHYHIIPRWIGDSNFFPVIAETKVIAETFEQTYDHLRSEFDKLGVE